MLTQNSVIFISTCFHPKGQNAKMYSGYWIIDDRSKDIIIEQQHEISNNMVGATSKTSDQSGHTHSLIRASASRLNIL